MWDWKTTPGVPRDGSIELVDVTGLREDDFERFRSCNHDLYRDRVVAQGEVGEYDRSRGVTHFAISYDVASIDPARDYAILVSLRSPNQGAPGHPNWWEFCNYGEESEYIPVRVLTKGRPHKSVEVWLTAWFVVS